MKTYKTIIVLALATALSGVCAQAFEVDEDTIVYGNLYFKIGENGGLVVVGCESNQETLIIPPYVSYGGNDYAVTEIGSHAICNQFYLKRLELPDALEKIGYYSICNNGLLDYLDIPSSVKSLGGSAFYYNCFKTLIIPDNIETIPSCLLDQENFEHDQLMHTLVLGRGVKSIGGSALGHIENLKELYIMCPAPPAIAPDSYPFNHSRSGKAVVYVPAESLPLYDKRPAEDRDYQYNGKYGFGKYDGTWAFFYDYRPIPDLFVVINEEEFTLTTGYEPQRIIFDTVNYAGVDVYSERWEYDSERVSIVNDSISGLIDGETEIKRVVETSTGTYESRAVKVKVGDYDPSGVALPTVDWTENPVQDSKNQNGNALTAVRFYSIDGRTAGNDASRLSPGVYIELRAGKACKFVKK